LILLASCASCGEHLGHERVLLLLLLLTRIAHGWCSVSQIRVRWYLNNALESFGVSFAVRVSAFDVLLKRFPRAQFFVRCAF